MEVFISWSGDRSRRFAEALRNWLPKVINALRPWLSSADIDRGARWSSEVAEKLEASKVGIICLTPSNLHSDWILFEAGALSKTVTNTLVCPLLVSLEPSDVKGPLSQFQATRANHSEMKSLMSTINGALGGSALSDAHLSEAFDMWWPQLESALRALPPEDVADVPHRSERDMLEEILALVRTQAREHRSEFIPPLYTPGHAMRRVEHAVTSLIRNPTYGMRIRGYELEKAGDHIVLKIDVGTDTLAVALPCSFQSTDDIRTTILEALVAAGSSAHTTRTKRSARPAANKGTKDTEDKT